MLSRGKRWYSGEGVRNLTSRVVISLFVVVMNYHSATGTTVQSLGGSVYVRHFTPRNSPLKYQIWSVVQDSRGVVYFADEDGVKIYDGHKWTLVPTASGTTVRSLAVSDNDVIFYGAQGEFGRLVLDESGLLRASPLSTAPELSSITFSDVWTTAVLNGGIIFQSPEAIFSWDGNRTSSWSSSTSFHTSFVVDGEYFVREKGVGLLTLSGQDLAVVDGGDQFSQLRVYMMEKMPGGGILIGTQEKGLFKYENETISHIHSELDNYQDQNSTEATRLRLYHGTSIGKGKYAIATLGSGIVVVDESGGVLYALSRREGLQDDWVNYVYRSGSDGIWLGFNNEGAAFLDISAPITKYEKDAGLRGYINDIARFRSDLFVATGTNYFQYNDSKYGLQSTQSSRAAFSLVRDIPPALHIDSFESSLYVSSESGVRIFRSPQDSNEILTCGDEASFMSHRVSSSGLVYVGTKKGLRLINRTDAECDFVPVGDFSAEVRSIAADADGSLWLGTRHQGVYRLSGFAAPTEPQTVRNYLLDDGLPDVEMAVSVVGGKPLFMAIGGTYRFDPAMDRFYLDEQLWPFEEGKTDSLLTLTEDHLGNVWMVFPDSVVRAEPLKGGRYKFVAPEALKFKKTSTSTILAEDDGVVWFNDGDELIRYDSNLDVPRPNTYHTLITRVTETGNGATIFKGAFRTKDGLPLVSQPNWQKPDLTYDLKDLTIDLAATSFTYPESIRFQTRIDGVSSSWSPWTKQSTFTISGLHEGAYTFRARSRDAQGRISAEASYAFVILPPWYRMWWAYASYIAVIALLSFSGRKYWLMVHAQKLAAEQAEELHRQKELSEKLQVANDRLERANKLKDEFLATTSHELRTPLTAILGFTAVLKDEIPEEAGYREFLDIIEDSGTRLMDTLNSLLDLAKLRAGMMEIVLEPANIYHQCRAGVSGYIQSARNMGLSLSIVKPKDTVFALIDVQGFQRVLANLVGNAIKFTTEGEISIEMDADEESVFVRVRDTGIGIDSKFLPQLFDEFVQESDGPSRTYEGTGLGLAITARLVHLMDGQIHVESEKGVGSTFDLTFPRTDPPVGDPIRVMGFGDRERA
jgi:signal transduction histidine kinase